MEALDPAFTERLEPALTILANQPTRTLGYLEDRFELETGELQAWLDTFNGGQKALKFARLHEVKRALQHKQAVPAFVAPPPPAAPEEPVRDYTPMGERAPRPPMPEFPPEAPSALAHSAKIKSGMRRARRAAPAKQVLADERAGEPRPAQPPAPSAPPAPAVAAADDGERPWETSARFFRADTFRKYRPAFERLAAGAPSIGQAAADIEVKSFYWYLCSWFGSSTGHAPEKIRAFIAWGDAKCAAPKKTPKHTGNRESLVAPLPAPKAEPESETKVNGREVVKNDEWHRWRADAIEALRRLGTPARQAAAKVDAAIAALKGEDVDTGELVKRALREDGSKNTPPATHGSPEPTANGAAETRAGRSAARSAPGSQPRARSRAEGGDVNHEILRVEITLRVVRGAGIEITT